MEHKIIEHGELISGGKSINHVERRKLLIAFSFSFPFRLISSESRWNLLIASAPKRKHTQMRGGGDAGPPRVSYSGVSSHLVPIN